MGNETTKQASLPVDSPTLTINANASSSSLVLPRTVYSASNRSPRSPITPISCMSPSPRSPMPGMSITPSSVPCRPLAMINCYSSDSASYTNKFNFPTLTHADSLSYSQKYALATDKDQLPKKLNDDEIINKNEGRKSFQKKKKRVFMRRSQSCEKVTRIRSNASHTIPRTRRINNGITGKYISEKIANCASLFWINNIDTLQRSQQLEIGCVQYFYLLEQYPDLSTFFPKDKIESTALRFFDMFGWLCRSLCKNGVNLWKVFAKIGEQHTRMGIKVKYYGQLLDAFHYAMSQHFTQRYTIQVKFSIDQIYTIATCIMTGRQYDQLSFGERVLDLNESAFLTNLTTCLEFDIGREYLYRYLGQRWCSELVVFLQLYQEYEEIYSQHHPEKLFKAREIGRVCMLPHSTFPINVSYSASTEFWCRLRECEKQYAQDADGFEMDASVFLQVWREVMRLIMSNHWVPFTQTIKNMQKYQQSLKQ